METNLRIAVIGAGKISHDHLKCLCACKNVELVGIANRSGRNLDDLADQYKIGQVFTNWEHMLDQTKPDAVWVISSLESLFAVTKGVISKGYDCFVEKPAALSSKEVRILAEAADKQGVKVMVGFNRRFYSPIMHSWLLSKSSGDLRSIHIEINENIWEVRAKKRHSDDIIEKWMIANSIHMIDLITFFGGAADVMHIVRTQSENIEKMSFNAQLSLAGGSVIGSIRGDWASPRANNIHIRLEDMLINFSGLQSAEIIDQAKEAIILSPAPCDIDFKMGFMKQTEYFINALLEDRPIGAPAANLWDCYQSVKLAESLSNYSDNR